MMGGMGGDTSADAMAGAERFGQAVRSAVGDVTLTEFLLARIAEDERDAHRAIDESEGLSAYDMAQVPFIDAGAPDRVLAECEAKRRIVELHTPQKVERRIDGYSSWLECSVCFDPRTAAGDYDFETWPCPTLRWVALPYADHSDYYRQEWRP